MTLFNDDLQHGCPISRTLTEEFAVREDAPILFSRLSSNEHKICRNDSDYERLINVCKELQSGVIDAQTQEPKNLRLILDSLRKTNTLVCKILNSPEHRRALTAATILPHLVNSKIYQLSHIKENMFDGSGGVS